MKKLVIFGAGLWGEMAYFNYKGRADILYYVDNDDNKWGRTLNGLKVHSPEILKNKKNVEVVIANNINCTEIKRQLLEDYGIRRIIIFNVSDSVCIKSNSDNMEYKRLVIVKFDGGLGNQMFQYAMYLYLKKKGLKVCADLSKYGALAEKFKLCNVFPNIYLEECSSKQTLEYEKEGKVFLEESPSHSLKISKLYEGVICGFYQTDYFCNFIRAEILNEYKFFFWNDSKLQELYNFFKENNIVGIHVRRGAYLKEIKSYGDLVKEGYYRKAINYITDKVHNPIFCFVSDDIKWVKNNFKELTQNVIFIEENMFINYYDWYDMFILSICKHNIIANSSFSWWGAWLNQNENKIVIAPQKWYRRAERQKFNNWVIPSSWIKI